MRRPEDYAGLAIPYHRSRPKFQAMIEGLTGAMVDARDLLDKLPAAFDIDEAIGVQLDVVGKWVGRSRVIPVPLEDPWFRWDRAGRGWNEGIWRGPYSFGTGKTILDDDTYRRLLYAKRAANAWDGRRQTGEAALRIYISDPATHLWIQDGFDMSDAVCVSGHLPGLVDCFIIALNLIPVKAAGVRRYYAFTSVDGAPLFGFDLQNSFLSGWDSGAWGVSADWLLNNT